MLAALAVTGYLLGSTPVAWLITRLLTGQDLRRLGSGNVGVMNVALSVARWAGLLVFLAEAAKGMLAVSLARALDGSEVAIGLSALAAVIGTRWPLWLRGTGGRGNTAGMGALLLISWPTLAVGLVIWLLARLIAQSSFAATRVSLALWPLALGLITRSWTYGLFGAALSLLYLGTQRRETDDHLLIKERWPSLWAFLTGPRRRR